MTKNKRLIAILPIVAFVVVSAVVAMQGNEKVSPQMITAEETTYTGLSDLVAASDLVVIAKATEVKDGRVVGSGMNTSSAIRTQLVTLMVGQVLKGAARETVVLEQEKTLASGAPIVVNNVEPTTSDDEGLYFLVQSKDADAPYAALVNRQGRYLVEGPNRDQLSAATNETLSAQLAALGPFELRCQVLAIAKPETKAECK